MKKVIIILMTLLMVGCSSSYNDDLEEITIDIPKSGDLEEYLYTGIKTILNTCEEKDVYSINFFIYSNEEYKYQSYSNLCDFSVSWNTESYYKGTRSLLGNNFENRWNYSNIVQDEYSLLDDTGMEKLMKYYEEQGIKNIGYESEDMLEPVGYKELLEVITNIGIKLQKEDYLKDKFGKRLPIIVQTLDVDEDEIDATEKINIHNEASEYLKKARRFYL